MFKKISFLLMTWLFSSVAMSASIEVPSVWGFAVGSTQGTYFREILNESNKTQNEFKFNFINIPGAGGAIATSRVSKSSTLSILAHSAAFFIRPETYKDTQYDVNHFVPLIIMGESPAVLMSNNTSLKDIQGKNIVTIGTAGAGSSTHLMAESLAQTLRTKGTEVIMIHYKNTIEAHTALLGRHIDLTFEFLGDATSRATNDIKFLGLTGNTEYNGIPLLKDLGFKQMSELNGLFAIFISTKIDSDTRQKLRTILLNAEKNSVVKMLYKSDFVSKPEIGDMNNEENLIRWQKSMIHRYKELTKSIKVE